MKPDPRIARSWLFVPGDSERTLTRSWDSPADAVIVDLEDAVAPENKAAARTTVREFLETAGSRRDGRLLYVRINPSDTGRTLDDLRETFPGRPDGYMIPKVERPEDVRAVAQAIAELEAAAEVERGTTKLVPIVTETPLAALRVAELCRADDRTVAVIWGTEDLGAAIGARRVKRPDGTMLDVFRTVRSMVLLAGAAAGVGIIDTPVVEIPDLERLITESTEASWMGFTGKLAIHPTQVLPINDAFLPDSQEVADAERLMALAREKGLAAFRMGGKMIDVPHIKAAQRVLATAQRHRAPR